MPDLKGGGRQGAVWTRSDAGSIIPPPTARGLLGCLAAEVPTFCIRFGSLVRVGGSVGVGEMNKQCLLGMLYAFLWASSIFSGFLLLCCPVFPLMLINQRMYRRLTDLIFAIWELYPVALMEVLFGTRIVVSGDEIRPESALIIMNHKTRCDWNFLWAAMFYGSRRPSHKLKFVLKAPIKHVPGPGWVMQMAGFLFIDRNWEKDEIVLRTSLDYMRDLKNTYQILIFPEGTDLTPHNLEKSNAFARSHNLEEYKRVLHPRTTGFSFLASKMRENNQLDAVYDLTVGYPDKFPQSEVDVVKGVFPQQVNFFVKRYPVQSLPTDPEDLKDWLKNAWKLKEQKLESFYKQQTFTPEDDELLGEKLPFSDDTSNALYLALLFWTSLILITSYLLMTSLLMQLWTLMHSFLLVVLSLTKGSLALEIYCFRKNEEEEQDYMVQYRSKKKK